MLHAILETKRLRDSHMDLDAKLWCITFEIQSIQEWEYPTIQWIITPLDSKENLQWKLIEIIRGLAI